MKMNTSPTLYRLLTYAGTRARGLTPANIGPWTEHHAAPKLAPRTLHERVREHLGEA